MHKYITHVTNKCNFYDHKYNAAENIAVKTKTN